jgi:carbon storage regulator
MLVLTRKIGDKVLLGEEIEIAVVDIQGNQVKLGISAPRALPVLRGELKDREAEAPNGARAEPPPSPRGSG